MLDNLFAVADECPKTASQVALNWLLRQPGVTAPIVGARTMEHLENNLGAGGWLLLPEQVKRLDAVSQTELPYPYDFIHDASSARIR